MPAPPADMLVTIDDESTPDSTKETVEACLHSAGFHTFWEAGLNVRPFEQTAENESLLNETIDRIQSELPEVEIIRHEGTNKDAGSGVTYSYYLTIEGETSSSTDSWQDTDSESNPPWRQSDDRTDLVAKPESNEGDFADSKEGDKPRVGKPGEDESWDPEFSNSTENNADYSPPEGPIVVAVTNNRETEYDFYRVEDPEDFFGDDWGDDNKIVRRIVKSNKEPEKSVENVQWVTRY